MYFSALFMLNFDAYAQNSAIEEVIVSAEKRNESLQDVSLSVTALTEEELESKNCLLYTSPSPRDLSTSRMPSSA